MFTRTVSNKQAQRSRKETRGLSGKVSLGETQTGPGASTQLHHCPSLRRMHCDPAEQRSDSGPGRTGSTQPHGTAHPQPPALSRSSGPSLGNTSPFPGMVMGLGSSMAQRSCAFGQHFIPLQLKGLSKSPHH